jgi:hypothetical protein
MAVGIGAGTWLLDGDVKVQSAGFEPDSAAMADGFGFGNFVQAEQSGVEGAGQVFAAFGHSDVDVGEAHVRPQRAETAMEAEGWRSWSVFGGIIGLGDELELQGPQASVVAFTFCQSA